MMIYMKKVKKIADYRVVHEACVAREKGLGFMKKIWYFYLFKTCHWFEFEWFHECFMK